MDVHFALANHRPEEAILLTFGGSDRYFIIFRVFSLIQPTIMPGAKEGGERVWWQRFQARGGQRARCASLSCERGKGAKPH